MAPESPGGVPTPYVGVDRLTNLGFWSGLATPRWRQFSGSLFLVGGRDDVRVTDQSNVGIHRVPRLKVEYQMTPSLFVRVVGQYDSNFRDALRDDSRTNRPIVVLDESSGTYSPVGERRTNSFQFDWLFSYRPTPGTVLFLGYAANLSEPQTYRFNDFTRLNDGFFLKLSYRYRV